MPPAISVVIPTRNRAEPLRRCLAALAGQTLDDAQVIVVDDASTDETPAMLERFRTEHPGLSLTVLRADAQVGANPARNRGIRVARAAIVAFTDDDCVPAPDWLERLLAAFDDDRVGAVTGRVDNVEARNVFELTWKGTQRVHSPDGRHASRLVGCNMAVRRALLLEHGLDEDRARPVADVRVSGRSDEEGLYLQLKAAGWRQVVAPDAIVVHDHPHTAATLMRQAWRGGRAAARLVHKYRLPPRLDLLPLLLAWLTLPLILLETWLAVVPAGFFALQLAALLYNELRRKGKTPLETAVTLPVLLVYYHARLAGYVVQTLRLWLRIDRLRRAPRR